MNPPFLELHFATSPGVAAWRRIGFQAPIKDPVSWKRTFESAKYYQLNSYFISFFDEDWTINRFDQFICHDTPLSMFRSNGCFRLIFRPVDLILGLYGPRGCKYPENGLFETGFALEFLMWVRGTRWTFRNCREFYEPENYL